MADTPISNTSNAHGRYVGLFGDSRAFLSFTNSGQFYDAMRNVGIATWIQGLGGGQFTIPRALGGGVAGNTLDQMKQRQAAYITTCNNMGCKRVIVIGGTNDVTSSASLGSMKKKMREIVRTFLQAGISVEVISETPRGNPAGGSYNLATQAQRDTLYQYHLWIENTLSKMCMVHNVWDLWVNPASGIMYYPKPEVTEDDIHPSKIGASLFGLVAGPGIGQRVHQLPDMLESNDLYSATFTGGSLINNPMLTGTTGTWQGGYVPVAGSVLATGWNASVNSFTGLKVYAYLVTDEDGDIRQCFQVTGQVGATDATLQFNQPIPLTNIAEGAVVKNTAIFYSSGQGIANFALRMLMTPSYTLKYDAENSNVNLLWPSDPIGPLYRETPTFTYAAAGNQTGLEMNIEMNFFRGSTVNAFFQIKKPGAFLVTY